MMLVIIMMMNVLPCIAFNNIIMEPMKAVMTHRAMRKLLEFKHNVEQLWTGTTTSKPVANSPFGAFYKLQRIRNPSPKFYRPEPLKKNWNVTQIYPKRLRRITTSKKSELIELLNGIPCGDSKQPLPEESTEITGSDLEPLRQSYGRRYTFYPLNINNFNENDNRKLYFHINRFPVKMKQIVNIPPSDKYNKFSTRYRARIISSGELDPRQKTNRTITLEIPDIMRRRQRRENGFIRVTIPIVQNILSGKSSYPRCLSNKKFWPLLGRYEPSNKKKVEKRSQSEVRCCEAQNPKTKREMWPLLGPYNQGPLSEQTQLDGGLVGQLAPAIGSKRNNQMHLISKLSEMKAKEHIAEDNRLAEMHKTQEAKRNFQERIAEQLDLLSEAKRADLRAKRAFEKVVKLERTLSEQDREIHRLKEFEDELYEELLESEAEVAMEDMQIIPKFINEEDLQEFMTGPKFT